MLAAPKRPPLATWGKGDNTLTNLILLTLLTVFAFAVMGYHPGLEDDAFYLAAIKRDLNPALYPYDSDFFRLQFQASVFDKVVAFSVRLTHLPLAWIALLWQFAAIFLLLHGCWRISRRCFSQPPAQWAAVTMIAVLLTLPVSGTAISIADQHLHPRTLATALILAAIVAVLDRRLWFAGILIVSAFATHALMASFGASFCTFLLWRQHSSLAWRSLSAPIAAALMPLGWLFEPASDAWRQAAATRGFYFLAQWHWYEWLGVFAPIVLLYACWCVLQRRPEFAGDRSALLPLLSTLLYYGLFQTVVGLAIMFPPGLERLRPLEPMRYLHLLYLMFFLIAGGLLGRYVLDRRIYRWFLLFLPLSAVMFYAQRQLYPASVHLELPGIGLKNPWLQAFAWIRQNTPVDSLFALNPHYATLPGEDFHGFRALAERSVLADYDKDGGMAARVPRIAPRWLREVIAQSGWQDFQASDFERLKKEFGVSWIILSGTDAMISNVRSTGGRISDPLTSKANDDASITCPYQNQQVLVCHLH
jgi:hypothetical protein